MITSYPLVGFGASLVEASVAECGLAAEMEGVGSRW